MSESFFGDIPKDLNIRILFGLQNSRIRIRIFKIRRKRFKSELNPNIFDHLCHIMEKGYNHDISNPGLDSIE